MSRRSVLCSVRASYSISCLTRTVPSWAASPWGRGSTWSQQQLLRGEDLPKEGGKGCKSEPSLKEEGALQGKKGKGFKRPQLSPCLSERASSRLDTGSGKDSQKQFDVLFLGSSGNLQQAQTSLKLRGSWPYLVGHSGEETDQPRLFPTLGPLQRKLGLGGGIVSLYSNFSSRQTSWLGPASMDSPALPGKH